MSSSSIHAVIFDCDGTLVDSESLSIQVLVDFAAEFGLRMNHEQAVARFAGGRMSDVLLDIESRIGRALPQDFLEQFRERQTVVLQQKLQPIAGADDLLSGVRQSFCVASNAPRVKIEICLRVTGLDIHFSSDRIFSAYDAELWKPDPDVFLRAAKAMRIDPKDCAVVEDSDFGIEAGLAAGMQVIAFCPRGPQTQAARRVRSVTCLRDIQGLLN